MGTHPPSVVTKATRDALHARTNHDRDGVLDAVRLLGESGDRAVFTAMCSWATVVKGAGAELAPLDAADGPDGEQFGLLFTEKIIADDVDGALRLFQQVRSDDPTGVVLMGGLATVLDLAAATTRALASS